MNPQLVSRLRQVQQRIEKAEQAWGRPADSVQLIAVSKRQDHTAIKTCFDAGQQCFGESYLQEALPKIEALAALPIEWHFIGPLQSNKTRAIAAHFDWVHSVASLRHAERLNSQRPGGCPPLNICLQVNISAEAGKAGTTPAAVAELAQAIDSLPALRLRGLMAIPRRSDDFATQRQAFHALRTLRDRLLATGHGCDALSMGMSNDLEAAIAEGATLVRVGTAIFGPRNQ